MKKIAEIQVGGKEGKKVLTKNTGAADEEKTLQQLELTN